MKWLKMLKDILTRQPDPWLCPYCNCVDLDHDPRCPRL